MDRLPTRTFFLLGAYFKKDHFSEEDGSFFMLLRRGFLRKKSKKDKKVYILSGPFWYTLTEKLTSGYVFHTILGCFGKCFLVLFQFLPNI